MFCHYDCKKEGIALIPTQTEYSPLPDEAAMAQLAYSRWERSEAETMAEYITRRRTVDLASLVRQVAQEELTDTERSVICLRYGDNLTPLEIAKRLQISRSAAVHTLKRAEERIRRYLKYVVQYQYDLRHVSFLPLAVREAMVVYAARYSTQDAASRLRKLRALEHLSAEKVGGAAGIPAKRLCEIENGQAVPDARELLRLSAFYGVSADSILKGEPSCEHH